MIDCARFRSGLRGLTPSRGQDREGHRQQRGGLEW